MAPGLSLRRDIVAGGTGISRGGSLDGFSGGASWVLDPRTPTPRGQDGVAGGEPRIVSMAVALSPARPFADTRATCRLLAGRVAHPRQDRPPGTRGMMRYLPRDPSMAARCLRPARSTPTTYPPGQSSEAREDLRMGPPSHFPTARRSRAGGSNPPATARVSPPAGATAGSHGPCVAGPGGLVQSRFSLSFVPGRRARRPDSTPFLRVRGGTSPRHAGRRGAAGVALRGANDPPRHHSPRRNRPRPHRRGPPSRVRHRVGWARRSPEIERDRSRSARLCRRGRRGRPTRRSQPGPPGCKNAL
jgi:hypothetical protein